MPPTRRTVLGSAAAVAATSLAGPVKAQSSDPILLGVSGPLTGPNAQYGAQWKDGFDLALDATGHKAGDRPLQYRFEDSQSDPRQAVAIAQKFVADPRIILELGDFSYSAAPTRDRCPAPCRTGGGNSAAAPSGHSIS